MLAKRGSTGQHSRDSRQRLDERRARPSWEAVQPPSTWSSRAHSGTYGRQLLRRAEGIAGPRNIQVGSGRAQPGVHAAGRAGPSGPAGGAGAEQEPGAGPQLRRGGRHATVGSCPIGDARPRTSAAIGGALAAEIRADPTSHGHLAVRVSRAPHAALRRRRRLLDEDGHLLQPWTRTSKRLESSSPIPIPSPVPEDHVPRERAERHTWRVPDPPVWGAPAPWPRARRRLTPRSPSPVWGRRRRRAPHGGRLEAGRGRCSTSRRRRAQSAWASNQPGCANSSSSRTTSGPSRPGRATAPTAPGSSTRGCRSWIQSAGVGRGRDDRDVAARRPGGRRAAPGRARTRRAPAKPTLAPSARWMKKGCLRGLPFASTAVGDFCHSYQPSAGTMQRRERARPWRTRPSPAPTPLGRWSSAGPA